MDDGEAHRIVNVHWGGPGGLPESCIQSTGRSKREGELLQPSPIPRTHPLSVGVDRSTPSSRANPCVQETGAAVCRPPTHALQSAGYRVTGPAGQSQCQLDLGPRSGKDIFAVRLVRRRFNSRGSRRCAPLGP